MVKMAETFSSEKVDVRSSLTIRTRQAKHYLKKIVAGKRVYYMLATDEISA